MVTNVPELGVVSTHQRGEWLCHNDDHQESDPSGLHQLTTMPQCDTDDGGVHVFVHCDDDFNKYGQDSEEEVIIHRYCFLYQI